MKKQELAVTLTALVTIFSLASSIAIAAPAYMDDADTRQPPKNSKLPSISGHKFPRVIMAETQSMKGDEEKYSKYNVIATSGGVIKKVASLQSKYPNLMYFRQMNGPEYLGYTHSNDNCSQSHGISFENTAASTGNCKVYAGHWLYQAGTTTQQSINTSTTSVKVADASRFTVGKYAVIYNTPAGSFANAEHAKVTGRNTSNNTLTLQRGYKSSAKSHGSGSIIAQHVTGQGGSALNWSFNMSSQSPKDGNGKIYSTVMVDFIQSNHTKDQHGQQTSAKVSGFLFDSDFHFILANKKADVNNDLKRDDGISGGGINWWGNGLDAFYAGMRNRFSDKYVIPGHHSARGFNAVNGAQMEGWPQSNGYHSTTPEYKYVSSRMSQYGYYTHHVNQGTVHSHVLTKTPTKIYPKGTGASSNKPFRFALGTGLMQDGYFGTQNSQEHPDTWFDEFAVDVNPNSANYGKAVKSNPSNEAAVRANSGWLGSPLGKYKRIYNQSDFDSSQTLITPGTFENNMNGWSGTNVNISRDTSKAKDGSASMKISKHTSYKAKLSSAQVKGPSPSLTKGTWYTLVFSAKSDSPRVIKANVGGHGERFHTGTSWRRYIMAFQSKGTGNQRISFAVGRENVAMSIDSVHLFQGNPNVFRRDFDNGIVVVNATPNAKYVNLGNTFQRIKGYQDTSVNNGASLSDLTIQPWDSAILVRPKGSTSTSGGSSTVNPELSIRSLSVDEDAGIAKVAVSLSASSDKVITVDYVVIPDTASPDLDYVASNGKLTFNAGVTKRTVNISILSDSLGEATEKLTVGLLNSVNAIITKSAATLSIINVQVDSGTTTSSIKVCGKPTYESDIDKGIFIWKDCSSDTWRIRALPGGEDKIAYSGRATSSTGFSLVDTYQYGGGDKLDFVNASRIDFLMKVFNAGVDGIDMAIPTGSKACFHLDAPAVSQVFIGPNKVAMPLHFNLDTFEACN